MDKVALTSLTDAAPVTSSALTWYALCVLHVSVQYEDYGSHPSTKKKKPKKKMGTGPCGKILHCTFQ